MKVLAKFAASRARCQKDGVQFPALVVSRSAGQTLTTLPLFTQPCAELQDLINGYWLDWCLPCRDVKR